MVRTSDTRLNSILNGNIEYSSLPPNFDNSLELLLYFACRTFVGACGSVGNELHGLA